MTGHDPKSGQNGTTNGPGPLGAAPADMGAGPLAFDRPAPEGAAKTMSQVLGEITWLMSKSPIHKRMFIEDLEWLVMTPALLQQFRLYYDSGDAQNAPKPIGVVLWAEVDAEVAGRLAQGVTKLRPQDWTSGARVPEHERQLWVVEVIAPFGPAGGGRGKVAEDMIRDLKTRVFPTREIRYTALGPQGKRVEVV